MTNEFLNFANAPCEFDEVKRTYTAVNIRQEHRRSLETQKKVIDALTVLWTLNSFQKLEFLLD